MAMDARDKHHHARAKAVAGEFGLEVLDVDEAEQIPDADWRAWAALPATRRMIGWIAEGFVASVEAGELADVKRKHTKGLRPGTGLANELARDCVLARNKAEEYRRLLSVIGTQANKGA